jgi:hypothetical protein
VIALFQHWLTRWLTRPVNASAPAAADPAALMAALRPGDVLLVDGKSRMSGLIRLLTRSSWSHVALYVGARTELGRRDGHALDLIEADIRYGVRAAPLAEYAQLHTRICRPIGLSAGEREAVIRYTIARLGHRYDLKNLFDLARRLLPLGRRRAAAGVLGRNDPQRVICSTLVAQAFASVQHPVLADVRVQIANETGRPAPRHGVPHHPSCIVPRDFDLSPYFSVIKPAPPSPTSKDADPPAADEPWLRTLPLQGTA